MFVTLQSQYLTWKLSLPKGHLILQLLLYFHSCFFKITFEDIRYTDQELGLWADGFTVYKQENCEMLLNFFYTQFFPL